MAAVGGGATANEAVFQVMSVCDHSPVTANTVINMVCPGATCTL